MAKILIEQEADHVHLTRGGDILMHCFWVEKMMVDLIILKNHPDVIERFDDPRPATIPRIMLTERCRYWQLNFGPIKNEFFKLFSPPAEVAELIDQVNVIRNALSHANIKLGQKYFSPWQ